MFPRRNGTALVEFQCKAVNVQWIITLIDDVSCLAEVLLAIPTELLEYGEWEKEKRCRAHNTSPTTGDGSHFTAWMESTEHVIPVAERSDGGGVC